MLDKIKIKKNSVQETLVIPLYARTQSSELYPEIYTDPESEKALKRLDFDTSSIKKDGMAVKFGALEATMREYDISREIKEYLEKYPKAAVVNLGCGLDPIARNLDNGSCKIYNIDLPDVIAVRNAVFPVGEREINIGADINDYFWFDLIDAKEGVIFAACGVFYYFKTEDVKSLFCALADRFPGGCLVFDTAGKMALKMMLSGIVNKAAGISDISVYFHAGNPKKDIEPWAKGFKVSCKGYMLGYHDLKVDSVPGFFRFMAKICDKVMKMKIVRLDFGESQ